MVTSRTYIKANTASQFLSLPFPLDSLPPRWPAILYHLCTILCLNVTRLGLAGSLVVVCLDPLLLPIHVVSRSVDRRVFGQSNPFLVNVNQTNYPSQMHICADTLLREELTVG